MNFCPKCGNKISHEGINFCPNCGEALSKYSNNEASSLDSFDFSDMLKEAQKSLLEKEQEDKFYSQAEVKDNVLIKYSGNDKRVNIPEGIVEISANAFVMSKAEAIFVPKTVKTIGLFAFGSISAEEITVSEDNPYYKSVDGVLYSKDLSTLIQYPRGKKGYYNMPSEVSYVGKCAVSCCPYINGITLSSRLTTIDDVAFSGLGVSSITIPESVRTIGHHAFSECNGLIDVTILGRGAVIGKGAFSTCPSLRTVNIGEGVTCIEENAFFNCSSLVSISLPKSLVTIGKSAFELCESLQRVEIPSGVSVISQNAFSSCKSLESVTLNEGITRIEYRSFSRTALKSVKIPYSVQSIDSSAFPSLPMWSPFVVYVPRGRSYPIKDDGRNLIEY